MDEHLLQGCEQCRRLAELVARIQEAGGREPVVPEHLVRAAIAVFRPGQPAPETPDWMALPPLRAQFASAGQVTAVPGMRSTPAAAEHVVYHAEDYQIDLQVERDPESNVLAIVGQLSSHEGSSPFLAGVPVVLSAGGKVIARTNCNQFGEFCLTVTRRQGLTLRVPLESADMQVVIPLAGLIEESR